jgi:alpha-aminoadipic semialdehyde synthase
VKLIVQASDNRIFTDAAYVEVGVTVHEDISGAFTTLAVKEIPLPFFESNKTYVFFAHVIKGQPYNMPMLKRMMELGCNLIDYEKVTDDTGQRLIFFGRHAGLAGMLDTFWAFGQRLAWEGIPNPFAQIRLAHRYANLDEAMAALAEIKRRIEVEGIPREVSPLILGVAGYGNVASGVQEILNPLPVVEILPDELATVSTSHSLSCNTLYSVVFKEEHMVEPCRSGDRFELQDYYKHPEKYRSKFEIYLPHLSILVNAIYWDKMYPRLVTKDYVRRSYSGEKPPRLRVIGDISCDVEGAIEVTVRSTEPGDPVFVYDPKTGESKPGYEGHGPVIMAVDILPSELPRESSIDFSRVLKAFIPAIAVADFSVSFDRLKLPPEIKRALILHQGRLTPAYQYLEKFLARSHDNHTMGGEE